jgi:hypothetical protein
MPSLYSDVDRSSWVYAPNFIRSRARYRGSRESYYLNREIMQLTYDFRRLYEKFDILDTTLSIDLEKIATGGAINATYVWDTDTAKSFVFNGLDDLSLRISRLKQRVEALEGGM